MYILGIGGSPRREGLSNSLLDDALDGARSQGAHVDRIIVNDLDIKPCQDCGGCGASGICVIKDDMLKVRNEIGLADAVIISTPIYFGSVTAQLKTLIDRFQDAWTAKYILKQRPLRPKTRKGALIVVSGSDKSHNFENAQQIVDKFFKTLDIEYAGNLFLGGSDILDEGPGKKEDASKRAFDLGASIAKSL